MPNLKGVEASGRSRGTESRAAGARWPLAAAGPRLGQIKLNDAMLERDSELQAPAEGAYVSGERRDPRVGLVLDVRDRALRDPHPLGEVDLREPHAPTQLGQRHTLLLAGLDLRRRRGGAGHGWSRSVAAAALRSGHYPPVGVRSSIRYSG